MTAPTIREGIAPLGPLAGRVVLVTGAGGGLGAATCAALAGAGMRVVAGDVDATSAAAVAARIEGAGGAAFGAALDVRDEASAAALVAAATDRFGGLDVLVNNAGTDVTKPFDE